MRYRKQQGQQNPQVNLVPMMDVLMTVLTFFIIISMTLKGQQVMNISLPQVETEASTTADADTETLIIGLNQQKQTLIESQPVSPEQLVQEVQTFLAQNPEGSVILKADRDLTYDDVAQVLESLRNMGGDRVSLGIDRGN
jgi:biopolymer transport protein ExbD